MKKVTKAAKIREMIKENCSTSEIIKKLKVKPQAVYTIRYQVSKEGKPPLRITSSPVATKPKVSSTTEFVREELASIERQIDSLSIIASFLTIRLRQLEQNDQQG